MTDQELLQQCKDDYAQNYRSHDYPNGFKDWKELEIHIQSVTIWIVCMNESAELAIHKAREEAAKEFLQIKNIGEDEGRADCTWGDTEYDSLSVAYGFNLCREHAFEIFDRIYKKLTAPGR